MRARENEGTPEGATDGKKKPGWPHPAAIHHSSPSTWYDWDGNWAVDLAIALCQHHCASQPSIIHEKLCTLVPFRLSQLPTVEQIRSRLSTVGHQELVHEADLQFGTSPQYVPHSVDLRELEPKPEGPFAYGGHTNYLIAKDAPIIRVHHLRRASDLLLDYRFEPALLPDLVAHNKFSCVLDKSEITLDWENDPDLRSFACGRLIKERIHIVPVTCPDDANVTNFKKYENEKFVLIRLPRESENFTQ